jgi:thioredoxin reductase (NADPH)
MIMYDVVIIGAGIGGLTAAIYAARKKMDYIILGSEFGGQFNESGEVLNYPGIVKTTGIEFSNIMREQMKFNGVDIKSETAQHIEEHDGFYTIHTDKGNYETKTIIIATGARPRKLEIKGEDEFYNKGLTYCAICDGPLFTGKDVAVVGSGSSALEAVEFLKDIANKIYLVIRGDHMKGHEYLQEEAKNNDKVEIIYNAPTREVVGDGMVTCLKYEQDGEEKTLHVEGVFGQIGRIPNTEFLSIVDKNDFGYVKVDKAMHTSKEGIYAIGDCADVTEHQYVISAGQGCSALIEASRFIAEHRR